MGVPWERYAFTEARQMASETDGIGGANLQAMPDANTRDRDTLQLGVCCSESAVREVVAG